MSKQTWKGSALIAPVPPVLVSCGTPQNPNVLTIAWTGIINTKPAKTYISIRPSRYSYDIIKSSKEFVINLPTKELVKAVDFCGVRSGKDIDKFKTCGLTAHPSNIVDAPMILESPLSVECKVFDIIDLGGTHEMFLADILSVSVDENLLDENGKLHLDKSGLLAFAHGEYFELGKKVGTFGFSVKKKKKKHKKNNKK